MTTWQWTATDLITGAVLADTIPLEVQSFTSTLNGGGTLTASCDFSADYFTNAPYLAALACRRGLLWAIADDWPVWAGMLWDWPHTSMTQGVLPVSAQTLDSLWSKRLITDTLEYAGVNSFAAFVDLLTYGMSKQSSHISPVSPSATRDPGYLAMAAARGRVAQLVVPAPGGAPTTWTAQYLYSDLSPVSSAWADMVSAGDLEFYFEPGRDANGNLAVYLRLGATALGRPLSDTGLKLTYPGNALDYGFTVTGSQSSNMVWATAPPNGSSTSWLSLWPHGADLTDLGNFPLLESTASWSGSVVTSQSQVNAYADGQAQLRTAGMTTPVIKVGGSSWPAPKDLRLGDAAWLSLTSQLHPPQADGSPGYQGEVRITGITVNPGGPKQPESYMLQTSAVPGGGS